MASRNFRIRNETCKFRFRGCSPRKRIKVINSFDIPAKKEDMKKKDQSISYKLAGTENKSIFLVATFSYNSFFWRKRFAERSHLASLLYSKIFLRNQDFYVFVDLLQNRILFFYLCNFWDSVNGTLNQAQLCIQEIFSQLKEMCDFVMFVGVC